MNKKKYNSILRKYYIVILSLCLLLGLSLVVIGCFLKPIPQNILISIGGSLFVSSFVLLLLYPSENNDEIEDLLVLSERYGFVKCISRTEFCEEFKKYSGEKCDAILSKSVEKFFGNNDYFQRSGARVIISDYNYWKKGFRLTDKVVNSQIITDKYVYFFPEEENADVFVLHKSKGKGLEFEKHFNRLWSESKEIRDAKLQSLIVSKETKQEEAIEEILKEFCILIKKKACLKAEIEAVVVLFCEENNSRMTFYSCNKGAGKNRHNIRDLNDGIVGWLIQLFYEEKCDCAIYYDSEMGDIYRYFLNNRTKEENEKEWKSKQGGKQQWYNKDTRSMFAVPFFKKDDGGNPTLYGALTFDLVDSIYSKTDSKRSKERIEDMYEGILATRNAIESLLVQNIQTDFLKLTFELDSSNIKTKNI